MRAFRSIVLVGLMACSAFAGSETALEVTGQVPKRLKLDGPALAAMPRQSVKSRGRDGAEVTYEGVPIHEVLKAAGLNLSADELRGAALEYYLIVEAADGYRVVFAMPELSPAYSDRVVLLADRIGGKPLGEAEGPLRIVVPGEKRQARWVRQVVRLRVAIAPQAP